MELKIRKFAFSGVGLHWKSHSLHCLFEVLQSEIEDAAGAQLWRKERALLCLQFADGLFATVPEGLETRPFEDFYLSYLS